MEARSVRHPARFSDRILDEIHDAWPKWAAGPILDPFAGVGKVHLLADRLGIDSVGVELEPEWAAQHPKNIVANALALPFADESFGAVVTSPTYGNRMADKHEARDRCKKCGGRGRVGPSDWRELPPEAWSAPADWDRETVCKPCDGSGLSRRNTYRHALGRPLTEGSGAGLQWGDAYRDFHWEAWEEAKRVLRPGGLFVLNISDHIRGGERQRVAQWHMETLVALGFQGVDCRRVETPRNRQGANGHARVPYEVVALFRRDAS